MRKNKLSERCYFYVNLNMAITTTEYVSELFHLCLFIFLSLFSLIKFLNGSDILIYL